MPEESPILSLPADEGRVDQLRKKLAEYESRIDGFRAPELQMGAVCKKAVLERLLRDGTVNTHELSRELVQQYGSGFDPRAFNNACGVIEDYCQTGGKNVSGGTGLR